MGFDREQDVVAGAGRLGEHGLGDMVNSVFQDQAAADVAVGATGARPEEAHEVVDFGGGGDGGAGVAGGVLLPDGNAGGDAFDFIDGGLFHAFEELAGVGREGLDVAALAFRVDGVEGEGALTGTGDAGYDGELVVGDGESEVLEVVEARTADQNLRLVMRGLGGGGGAGGSGGQGLQTFTV